MTRLTSWMTGAMKSPRRSTASVWTAGRKEAATTSKPSTGKRAAAVHEASHAVVAVLLGLKARAFLHADTPGCGTTDIDVPDGPGGDERLLIALVAGSEAEGRLLHQVRRWHTSTEDARAIARLVGGITEASTKRLFRAKRKASELVRDKRVWSAIEAVAWQLDESGTVEDATVREAVAAAGLRPTFPSQAGAEEGRRGGT